LHSEGKLNFITIDLRNYQTMKQFGILIILIFSLFSCEDNSMWVGKSEYVTISYSNTMANGPAVDDLFRSESPFVKYDTAWAQNIGGGTVQVILDGVRIQSTRSNFEIEKIQIFEEDKGKFEIQDEFSNLSTSNKTDIATVLVLDMSTSLGDLVVDLKTYAKSFVDQVVQSTENSKVAVVFFSGKDEIYATDFYDYTNADLLKTEIDNYTNYQSRTALFQATLNGLSLLDALSFEGTKALVVFTDGGDNDSNNPTSLQEEIADSPYLRISIGLEGEDFDRADLLSIADSPANSIRVNKKEKLERVFNTVGRQVVSVYKVVYERSDQTLDKNISIKFEFEVAKIK